MVLGEAPSQAASCDLRGAGPGRRGPCAGDRPTGRPGSVVLATSVAEEVLLRRSAACCASTAARSRTPTTTTGALRRLGACLTDDAARRAVERAVGTEEGALW